MHVYPITFYGADGTSVAANGELVTDMTLARQDWFLTPSGNGIEYSGNPAGTGTVLPTPTWATVPNFQNLSTATTINLLTGYVTPTAGVALSIAQGTLPVGWTFGGGTAMAYSGTGSSAPTPLSVAATFTANGNSVNSNTFYVNGVLSAGGTTPADVTAPTVPVGVQVLYITTSAAQIQWFPSSDPSPSGANWVGMSSYGVAVTYGTGTATNVSGSPFTVAAAGTGNQPVLTFADIGLGTGTAATTFSQSGADVTFTNCYANSSFGTSDSMAIAMQGPISGTGWTVSCQIAAFANSYQYAKVGIGFRNSLSPGDAYIRMNCNPFAQGAGIDIEARASVNAQPTSLYGRLANTTAPVYMIMQQVTATQIQCFLSFTGNIDSTSVVLGTFTFAAASSFWAGASTNTDPGQAVPYTATVKQLNIQQQQKAVQNLSILSPSTTYTAALTATDGTNTSAASTPITFTTAGTATSTSGGLPTTRSKYSWPYGNNLSSTNPGSANGYAPSIWTTPIGSGAAFHNPTTLVNNISNISSDIEMMPNGVGAPAFAMHTATVYAQASGGDWSVSQDLCAYQSTTFNPGTPNVLPFTASLPDNYQTNLQNEFPQGTPNPINGGPSGNSNGIKANFCCGILSGVDSHGEPNINSSNQFARCGTGSGFRATTWYVYNTLPNSNYNSSPDAPFDQSIKAGGRVGGHGASHLGVYGGSLRVSAGDVTGPIYHPLKMTLTTNMMWKATSYSSWAGEKIGYGSANDAYGYVYPAMTQDGGVQYQGNDKYLKMGSWLSFNMTSSQYATFRATLTPGGFGRVISDALYYYGVIVCEVISGAGNTLFPYCAVEPDPITGKAVTYETVHAAYWGYNIGDYSQPAPNSNGSNQQKYQADLRTMFANLQVITNVDPTNIIAGAIGGGTPRIGPFAGGGSAPPFSD